MKTNIATTCEQSDRLLQCGVPAESADMHFDMDEERYNGWRFTGTLLKLRKCPTWSLSALLGLLPKEIKADGTTYKLNIDYPPIGQVAVRYNTEDDDLDSLFGLMGDDLFELIVLMAEKLTANGYKLNGIEKGGED